MNLELFQNEVIDRLARIEEHQKSFGTWAREHEVWSNEKVKEFDKRITSNEHLISRGKGVAMVLTFIWATLLAWLGLK